MKGMWTRNNVKTWSSSARNRWFHIMKFYVVWHLTWTGCGLETTWRHEDRVLKYLLDEEHKSKAGLVQTITQKAASCTKVGTNLCIDRRGEIGRCFHKFDHLEPGGRQIKFKTLWHGLINRGGSSTAWYISCISRAHRICNAAVVKM